MNSDGSQSPSRQKARQATPPATVGDIVGRSLHNHGRADYLAARPFNASAAKSWQEGWIYEAQLAANAAATPGIATIMAGLELAATLEAFDLVLRNTITARPTRHQQQIVADARRLLDLAMDRLPKPGRQLEQDTDHGHNCGSATTSPE